jgi:phosphatidylglycerophosphate synthase
VSSPASGADGLTRRLLGRREGAIGVDVVAVVDPGRPGAAPLRTPAGAVQAEDALTTATREAGEPVGVVRAVSVTATVDELRALLLQRSDVPLAVLDASTVATVTSWGDLVADPRPAGSLLRDDDGAVVGVRVPSRSRAFLADALGSQLDREPRVRVVDLVADACDVAGIDLADRSDALLPVRRAEDTSGLASALSAREQVDEVTVRLRRAQRSDDGFLSTFGIRPISRRLTPVAVRRGVAPSSVTAVALVLGLLAAGAYALAATGQPLVWRVVGSVLLLGSLVVDCVDGEVARSTRTASPRGGWLDVGADRVKEYAVYAGLAAGADGRTAWWLALAAMALLVSRHFVDFGFASHRSVMRSVETRPSVLSERITQRGGGGAVAAWSDRTSSRPAAMWAKRAVIMPVGERTILLIVLAPLAGVRVTLVALLVLGVVAAAWTTAGRVGRTLLGPGEGSLWSRAAWLRPAVERVLEQGLVAAVVAALAPEAVPAAYAWLAVVAFGHYDLVYRQRLAGVFTTGGLLGPLPFPWPVRVLVVLVVLLVAGDRAGGVLVVLTALLALALVRSSIRFWSRWVPSTP